MLENYFIKELNSREVNKNYPITLYWCWGNYPICRFLFWRCRKTIQIKELNTRKWRKIPDNKTIFLVLPLMQLMVIINLLVTFVGNQNIAQKHIVVISIQMKLIQLIWDVYLLSPSLPVSCSRFPSRLVNHHRPLPFALSLSLSARYPCFSSPNHPLGSLIITQFSLPTIIRFIRASDPLYLLHNLS